jgi:hypothetical protein
MTKSFTFAPDDSLTVVVDNGPGAGIQQMTCWSFAPEHVARQRVDFDADMSPSDKSKADAIKAKHK